jgi:flagellar motility protein MotE (MotC chaperone)
VKLSFNRKPVARDLRLRLFPAVAGAAAALLLVKAVEFSVTQKPAAEPIAQFALERPDPLVTGSTSPPKEEPASPSKEKKPAPAPPPEPGTKVDLEAPATSQAEKELLERLAKRRQELEQREQELQTRENLLKAADKKMEQRILELKNLEGNAAQKAEQSQEQPQAGLKNLVVMYEAMKPKDAARVFDKLSMQVLIPVVQAMNPRKMSEILAAMSPDVAGRLTVELAARSLNVPPPAVAPAAAASGALPAGELQAIPQKKP